MKRLYASGLMVAVVLLMAMSPAHAQQIKKNALEKSTWNTAPREIQIIDDRPVVRDFREAPQQAGTIDLSSPGAGGGGGGALGNLGNSLPAGGLQLGGPNQGVRSAPSGMSALPRSGFGASNIPIGGMGPRGALPGVTQGGLGNRMTNRNKGVGSGAGAPSGRTVGHTSGPAVSSYSGGYGSGSGPATGGSASRTESMVRGTLLRSK